MTTDRNPQSPQRTPDCKEWFLYRPRTRSAKKKLLSFSDTIVISSDSEGSDDEGSRHSHVTEIFTKKEIHSVEVVEQVIVDSAVSVTENSENLDEEQSAPETTVEVQQPDKSSDELRVQLIESQPQYDPISSDDSTDMVIASANSSKIVSPTRNSNNGNNSENELAEVVIDGACQPICLAFDCEPSESESDSVDSIDMLIKGKRTSAQNPSPTLSASVSSNAFQPLPNATENLENETSQDDDQTNSESSIKFGVSGKNDSDHPVDQVIVTDSDTLANQQHEAEIEDIEDVENDLECQRLVYSSEYDESCAQILCDENVENSNDSFGLVIDEQNEKNSMNALGSASPSNDTEILHEDEEDIKGFMIIDEDDNQMMDDEENAKSSGPITFDGYDETNLFNKFSQPNEKKTFFESRSMSDDELVSKGRYGARVKYEALEPLPTSSSFAFENIKSSGNAVSHTNNDPLAQDFEVNLM